MVDGLCADSRKVRARSRKKGALLLENIIEQIFEPQFRQISLRPVSGNNQIKGSGITYRPTPDVGRDIIGCNQFVICVRLQSLI